MGHRTCADEGSRQLVVASVRRRVIVSALVSVAIGASGMAFWFLVEEVDADLCTFRTDGEGLVPLPRQFGPNVACDPRWGFTAIGAGFYSLLIFPFVYVFFMLAGRVRRWRRALRR